MLYVLIYIYDISDTHIYIYVCMLTTIIHMICYMHFLYHQNMGQSITVFFSEPGFLAKNKPRNNGSLMSTVS